MKKYLMYTVRTGSFVGLVQYSDVPTALTSSLIEITSDLVRNLLTNLVRPKAAGSTGIGAGLLKAQEVILMVSVTHLLISSADIVLLHPLDNCVHLLFQNTAP